jgi:hypothetical protein
LFRFIAVLPLLTGPCDTDFGQQVGMMKFMSIICIDQLAMQIDKIKGQEAFIVKGTSFNRCIKSIDVLIIKNEKENQIK